MEIRKAEDVVKKISLGGNIQTIFWLYLLLLAASLAEMFIFEVRLYNTVWNALVVMIWSLKMMWQSIVGLYVYFHYYVLHKLTI